MEGKGGDGKGKREGREERGMGARTHWDFRESAPMSQHSLLCKPWGELSCSALPAAKRFYAISKWSVRLGVTHSQYGLLTV